MHRASWLTGRLSPMKHPIVVGETDVSQGWYFCTCRHGSGALRRGTVRRSTPARPADPGRASAQGRGLLGPGRCREHRFHRRNRRSGGNRHPAFGRRGATSDRPDRQGDCQAGQDRDPHARRSRPRRGSTRLSRRCDDHRARKHPRPDYCCGARYRDQVALRRNLQADRG